MKKTSILLVLVFVFFGMSITCAGERGIFYIPEGSVLRKSADEALLSFKEGKVTIRDGKKKYFAVLEPWRGKCRRGTVFAPNGKVAKISICGRRPSQQQSYAVQQRRPQNQQRGYVVQQRRPQYQQYRGIEQQVLTQGYVRSMQNANVAPQYGLRGRENAPYQNRTKTNVDHNVLYGMSKEQGERYKSNQDWMRRDERNTIQNNAEAADAEAKWVRDQQRRNKQIYQQNIERVQGWIDIGEDVIDMGRRR